MAEIDSGAMTNLLKELRIAVAAIAMVALFGVLLFVPAGRWDWPLGWGYLCLIVVSIAINWACLARWNPDLIERRVGGFGTGTKNWDKVWAAFFSPLMIAIYVVAGMDARDGTSSLSWAAIPIGLAIFLIGWVILDWSMVVNPFFEKSVRIQTDRGHRVIEEGPYAYVRHPGYVGFTGWILSTPLLLGSAWALIPAAAALAGIVVRTALEDRTLHNELPGYAEYTKRVRFRLIPGVW